MLSRKVFVAIGIVMALGAPGAAIAACSSKATSPPLSTQEPVCTDGGLVVAFNPMYSAYIPGSKHTFLIPAVVHGSTRSVTWSADTSMVAMRPDPDTPNGLRIQPPR